MMACLWLESSKRGLQAHAVHLSMQTLPKAHLPTGVHQPDTQLICQPPERPRSHLHCLPLCHIQHITGGVGIEGSVEAGGGINIAEKFVTGFILTRQYLLRCGCSADCTDVCVLVKAFQNATTHAMTERPRCHDAGEGTTAQHLQDNRPSPRFTSTSSRSASAASWAAAAAAAEAASEGAPASRPCKAAGSSPHCTQLGCGFAGNEVAEQEHEKTKVQSTSALQYS